MNTRRFIPLQPAQTAGQGMDRRGFLKLLAASMALAGAGCSPPTEHIVPYADLPEANLAAGEPRFYATSHVLGGFARGVLVQSQDGRPTKAEGNPLHSASLGASDLHMQASILELWDPDRSQMVWGNAQPASWGSFADALAERSLVWRRKAGEGLRILTGPTSSPTLAAQMQRLLARFPAARWHAHDPLFDGAAAAGTRMAFGRPLDTLYRFDKARVVLSLDADFLCDLRAGLRHARDWASARAPDGGMARLYAVEAVPSLTGAAADHRMALPPWQIERLAWRLAGRLGLAMPSGLAEDDSAQRGWIDAIAADLQAHHGAGLVVAGPRMPASVHALVHHINASLGNAGSTTMQIEPVLASPPSADASMAALLADMQAGQVDGLLILDANPAYDMPAQQGFEQALRRVPFSVHMGLYRDETGNLANWHLPMAHGYEQWSDARASDGSAGIIQPVIAPLYGGRSPHVLLALMLGEHDDDHACVRDHWRAKTATDDLDGWWRQTLATGVVANTAAMPVQTAAREVAPSLVLPQAALVVALVPDPTVLDGRFANNAWLQELPKPMSQLTWDNALQLGPATAARLGLAQGDMAELAVASAKIAAPVWIDVRQPEGVAALSLGHGRRAAGSVGNGIGVDAYAIRDLHSPWLRADASVRRIEGRHDFAVVQLQHDMDSRPIVREASLDSYRAQPGFAAAQERQPKSDETLYPPVDYLSYRWAMTIDLNACIGCGVCTLACQAENNIPTVGKNQVARGRHMHWIRVDRYEAGRRTLFQPVPCMHCEDAPCEAVCPVGATVHDSEGLNVQVYNRCIGTRFCSNNCPYKVRRFNFLQYSDGSREAAKGPRNADVTVRQRGVMEKCSYCVQRISRARIAAERDGRPLRDGDVVTACQAACPTRAIHFGDLNDPASEVVRSKASPRHYTLLAELNTRPRTGYLARIRNPHPALAKDEA